jgi:hypothetical protein
MSDLFVPTPFLHALETVGNVWDVIDHITGGLLGFAEDAFDLTTQSLLGWIGYAYGGGPAQPFIGLFVQPGSNAPLVKTSVDVALATSGRIVPTRVIAVNAFTAPRGAVAAAGTGQIRPGESVMCTSDSCTGPLAGPISAILRPRNTLAELWILGNHHVLARQLTCRFQQSGVPEKSFAIKLQSSGATIATDILTVELNQGQSNPFDACAAKLLDPTQAVANYSPLVLSNGTPVDPQIDDPVQKFGPATGLTDGVVRFINARVKVDIPSSGVFQAQLFNQILIGLNTQNGRPFFADGDSGSLVLHGPSRQPAGILVGGGTSVTDNQQYTVVSPLDAILSGIHPTGDLFEIVV